jgi:hypothetical protein
MADSILLEIIDDHLPYEIDMLRGTYTELCALGTTNETTETPKQKIYRQALIESFCVHARSLFDFFSNNAKNDDAVASHFTANPSPLLDQSNEPLKALRTKLNKQIFHLTKSRKIPENEKFLPSRDASAVLAPIEGAIAEFKKQLPPDYEHFKCTNDPIRFMVTFPQASASSHSTAITGTSWPPKEPA